MSEGDYTAWGVAGGGVGDVPHCYFFTAIPNSFTRGLVVNKKIYIHYRVLIENAKHGQ